MIYASSTRTLACELVTLTPRTRAFSRMVTRLRAETVDAISAAKLQSLGVVRSDSGAGESSFFFCKGRREKSQPFPTPRDVLMRRGRGHLHLGVHEERLEVTLVVDQELLVPAREDVAGLLVAAVTDLGHRELALEAATDAVVDTLGLAPCLLDTVVTVRLVALLLVGSGIALRIRVSTPIGGGPGFGGGRRTKGFVRFLTILIDVAAILLPASICHSVFAHQGGRVSARHSALARCASQQEERLVDAWRVVLSPGGENIVSSLLPPLVPHTADPNPAGRGFEPGTRSPFAASAATTPKRCRPPRTGPSLLLLVLLLPADQSLVRIHDRRTTSTAQRP